MTNQKRLAPRDRRSDAVAWIELNAEYPDLDPRPEPIPGPTYYEDIEPESLPVEKPSRICFRCRMAQVKGYSAYCADCQKRNAEERPTLKSHNRCAKCREDFGSLTLFDQHQNVGYGRKASPVVMCHAPQALGLVQDQGGTWYTPEGLNAAHSLRDRLASARSRRAPGEGL